MSGFLPDLASWALRGGAGNDDEEEGNGNEENGGQQLSEGVPVTAEELRAQRLARMEELQAKQQQQQQQQQQGPQPMDVDSDDPPPKKAKPAPMDVEPTPAPAPSPPVPTMMKAKKKAKNNKNKEESSSPVADAAKLQRKKEFLLRKTLQIALTGTSMAAAVEKAPNAAGNNNVTILDTGSTEISVASIAEILATRLSVDKPTAMSYLGKCHYNTSEELKSMKATKKPPDELLKFLEEIQKQVVSYAATCLMEPDLFPSAKDAEVQLAKCLLHGGGGGGGGADSSNIMLGVGSSTSSFYYQLVEELESQDAESPLNDCIHAIARYYGKLLSNCESVLENVPEGDCSPIQIVTALTSLCSHKSAAAAVATMPTFLLPVAGSAQATKKIQPPLPTGANPLQQFLAGASEHRPYLGRSGRALDKTTVLGLCFKVGMPKYTNNPAFSYTTVLRQSPHAAEQATRSQRQQLQTYQNACHQLTMSLIKAGAATRQKVMQWFTDALLVNAGAAALRPDPSKVSSSNLLLNVSVLLLKLCQPFVDDEKKQHLIAAGFVSSEPHHGGVFAVSGDDAVKRLGDDSESGTAAVLTEPYQPKNSFIPQCFFFCARSLHLGVAPLLSQHENLLRHISHYHWQLQSQNRDIHTDPRFSTLISRQRAEEVALFQDEMMENTLRFCNFQAKVLLDMDDATLRTMPEDFVSDICDILLGVANQKPKLLGGLQFRYVFKLVVKLLSAKYANMVRNYNLRAQLGDILYELFLPRPTSDRREVPASVTTDPLAGGQTYLLSDAKAQETLAPSLLLLYGEVEHTGHYEKMTHRAKIASLIKYLWESSEHRPAFKRITENKQSFIKFANGMMNETNTLIATVMQKLPEIREAQEQMKNTQEWGRLSEDEQNQISSRLEDNEREVKSALPLCNKTVQMFGYLNTDESIRNLFLLDELCGRLVSMLLHVLTKLVGSKGLDLKVDNPEQYDFRPKEMLRDLCAIFALFASSEVFQVECAKAGCDPNLLRKAITTCRRLNLLTGDSMEAFQSLPDIVEAEMKRVSADEEMLVGAPNEFLDEIMTTYMKDPVLLPSGHYVDRSTITQHLLNDPTDPFNREPLTIDQVQPATELKEKMNKWLDEKRASQRSK